jgi:aspartate aminotransferase
VVPTSIENDFKKITQLEAAITPKLKWCGLVLLVIRSVYREELTALAKVLEKYPEIIVADEIYEHINFQELL